MRVLAFGASSSRTSINKQLATYVAHLIPNAMVTVLDLNDFDMPLYSIDREQDGIPALAHDFLAALSAHDVIVISLAEHNGSYAAAFKNVLDWVSRINNKLFQQKQVLLLATSPGARGAIDVLTAATQRFARMDANIVGTFSLPSFDTNFNQTTGITDAELKQTLMQLIAKLT
jgi:chromate reductase